MLHAISDLFNVQEGRTRRLAPGEYLFHRDDPVSHLFIVLAGEVQLIRLQESGGAIILQRAGPGDILAEASVFSSHFHCDAVARGDSEVRSIGRGKFLERFHNDPKFAEVWGAHLAREIQATRLRSEILSLRTVAERLDAWLAWHENLPRRGEWAQIAVQIGVSPEALYREIAKRRP
jgi:CRP-like cAMP-binding protein